MSNQGLFVSAFLEPPRTSMALLIQCLPDIRSVRTPGGSTLEGLQPQAPGAPEPAGPRLTGGEGTLDQHGLQGQRAHRHPAPARRFWRYHWAPLLALFIPLIALPMEGAERGRGLNPPQQVIQGVSDGLMGVLREDRELLGRDPDFVHRLVDRLLLPNVDFSRVSALVLGPHWREASPTQRRAFEAAFKTLLIQTYASALDRLSTWELRFPPMRLDPDQTKTLVRTELQQPGGGPVAVDYRMAKEGGRWVAYDVLVEGVSLLASYRTQLSEIARTRGIEGLLAELDARNATKPQVKR